MLNNLKSIKICGIPYKIKPIESDSLMGEIRHDTQELSLVNSMVKPEQIQATILHECVHGILYNLGYNKLNQNECLVQSLSIAIKDLIQDNPKLITYLTGLTKPEKKGKQS